MKKSKKNNVYAHNRAGKSEAVFKQPQPEAKIIKAAGLKDLRERSASDERKKA